MNQYNYINNNKQKPNDNHIPPSPNTIYITMKEQRSTKM